MNLRQSKAEDLSRVVEIYNSSIPGRLSTADTSPVTNERKKSWFFSHSKQRPLLIYEESGSITGWASIRNYNERPAYKNAVEISIYIDYPCIGRGKGTAILSECMQHFYSLKLEKVIPNVFSHNTASLRLFEKFGFEKWGELKDVCEMDGRKYSVTVLGCSIENI